MLLNRDQDLLADLSIAICSSFFLFYDDDAREWHTSELASAPTSQDVIVDDPGFGSF